MITKFDSLYAGHADLDNVGYGGTPINARRYSNAHLATALSKAEAMAVLMDRLGYNCFWMAEHHFQREGTECIPNNILMGVHLAHRTKNIKIGCGFNITPMWHPLRMAEDYAVADILTGGRIVFGVGRGYHTREVETFGSPLTDQDANRELFEEQVDIIFKAFNEESFAHKGKHYTLPPEVPYRGYALKELTLVPRPFRLPVECWQPIQGGSPRALEFMAKHGIQGMVGGGSAEGGAMHRVVLDWRAAHAKLGKQIELDMRGSDFQKRVWNLLRAIPAGTTVSYGDIAARMGTRDAREVASAIASNRIAILVPCHRVIKKDGSISGYRWGVGRKRVLLEREQSAGRLELAS